MGEKNFDALADTIVQVVCGDLGFFGYVVGFFGYVDFWDGYEPSLRVPFYGLDGLRKAMKEHLPRENAGFSVAYARRGYPDICDVWAGHRVGDMDPIVWDALGIGDNAGRSWVEWAMAHAGIGGDHIDAKIAHVLLAIDAGAPIALDYGDFIYNGAPVRTIEEVIEAARKDGYIE